jgi:DNA-binding response OmpR family regulator
MTENKNIKILIVEDERHILEFIELNLKMSGFHILKALSGEEALDVIEKENPHIVILDIMLPGIDGFEVCKRIRQDRPKTAIIMLTALGQDMDKVMGLEMGADDYIVKPFNPLELIARIRALIRRMGITSSPKQNLETGPFKLDTDAKTLLKGEVQVELTPREYGLVKTLIENPNKALSRDELLNLAWGEDYFGDTKTLDVHIRRLREKMEDLPSDPKYITTVWGYGYMWKESSN